MPFRARTSGDGLAAGTKSTCRLAGAGHVETVRVVRQMTASFRKEKQFRALLGDMCQGGSAASR